MVEGKTSGVSIFVASDEENYDADEDGSDQEEI